MPLRRTMRTAWLTRSPPLAEAVITTASAPAPPVQAEIASSASLGAQDALGAELVGQCAALLERLDSGHACAGRPQRLHRDQSEQSEPDDHDAVAERRIRAADALDGDRSDRRERGVAQRDALGHGHDEVRRDRHDLGVVRAARACAGDALADVDAGVAARVEDDARARVAERIVLGDSAAHRADRLPHAVVARVLERLRDEVRVLDRARRERARSGGDDGALGPARDRRRRVRHEYRTRARRRLWDLDDLRLSAPQNDLFHAVSVSSAKAAGPGFSLCSLAMARRRRVLSVVGTRPNMMKIAPIAAELGRRGDEFEHVLVHTGQHYDREMSEIFLEELGVGEPDYSLRRRVGLARAADRCGHGAPRAGAARGRARHRPRPRRCELDDGRLADRCEAPRPHRARRSRPALVRPDDAGGDQPDRRRPALAAPLHPLARGARQPAGARAARRRRSTTSATR